MYWGRGGRAIVHLQQALRPKRRKPGPDERVTVTETLPLNLASKKGSPGAAPAPWARFAQGLGYVTGAKP